MVEDFINYLQYEKRYSLHTVISYKTDLEQFFDFLRDHYNINELSSITPDKIRSWFVILIDNKISTRTINRKRTALKTFFNFLQKQGLLKQNPATKVLSLKISKRLPTFIEKDKLDSLLDNLNAFGKNDLIAFRDRLILEMLYSTGMRLSELVNLKEEDIDHYNSTIKVLGKRNKERIIPFNSHLKGILDTYLNLKKTERDDIESRKWLFITNSGNKIYHKLVYRVVNSYLSEVTTQKKRSPHVLRHTFATHLLDNGADLNIVKEILGHSNLTATQIYTHNSIEKLKSSYKQAHPKA